MRFILFLLFALMLPGTIALADPKPPITIPEAFRTCTVDSDCVLVEAQCNGCCNYDAISVMKKDPFTALYTHYCSDYKGPVCGCTAPDIEPVCKKNRCTTVNPYADEHGNVLYE